MKKTSKLIHPSETLITNIVSPDSQMDAVRIFFDSFKKKVNSLELKAKSEEQAQKILHKSMNYENAFYCLIDEVVVGVIGLRFGKNTFYHYKWDTLKEEFGFFGGFNRYLNQFLTNSPVKRGELHIEAIAVDKNFRSQGIGSKLINHVMEYAKSNDFKVVSLDVVDSNPRAFALYQRLGFEVEKKINLGFLTKEAGFEIAYIMRKEI